MGNMSKIWNIRCFVPIAAEMESINAIIAMVKVTLPTELYATHVRGVAMIVIVIHVEVVD